MRVVVGERLGGPEVLTVAERAAPQPGPGEIVVDVAAAGGVGLLLTQMVRRRGGIVVPAHDGSLHLRHPGAALARG